MSEVVETWFALRDQMLEKPVVRASAMRPPSLRDACYAHVLSLRSQADTTPETIEAFVNGLEIGAISALATAWKLTRPRKEKADATD